MDAIKRVRFGGGSNAKSELFWETIKSMQKITLLRVITTMTFIDLLLENFWHSI